MNGGWSIGNVNMRELGRKENIYLWCGMVPREECYRTPMNNLDVWMNSGWMFGTEKWVRIGGWGGRYWHELNRRV